jgi:hypothetical protein
MDFWNGLGLFLTFCGAALAFWQAHKAKTYKEEIQADRQKLILIEIMPIAKSARDECKKIVTPVNKPMRGVDPNKVINSIQELAEKLQEHSHRLKGDFREKESVIKLQAFISKYKNESVADERSKVADSIYSELNAIVESLSISIDGNV